jgi:hypothetical protein
MTRLAKIAILILIGSALLIIFRAHYYQFWRSPYAAFCIMALVILFVHEWFGVNEKWQWPTGIFTGLASFGLFIGLVALNNNYCDNLLHRDTERITGRITKEGFRIRLSRYNHSYKKTRYVVYEYQYHNENYCNEIDGGGWAPGDTINIKLSTLDPTVCKTFY